MLCHGEGTPPAQNPKVPQSRADTKDKIALPLNTLTDDPRDKGSKGNDPTPKSLTLRAQGKSTQNASNTHNCSLDPMLAETL